LSAVTRPTSPVLDPAELERLDTFRALAGALRPGALVSAGGLWGSAQMLALAALTRRAAGPWVVLTSKPAEAEAATSDLEALGLDPLLLPARESHLSGGASVHADAAAVRGRLIVAERLAGPPEERPRLLVAPLLALLQPLPDPSQVKRDTLELRCGKNLEVEDLLERLVGAGYERTPLAERPGEVSLRGDILDVFAFSAELPLRVELFDEAIESLRTFDPADQRSVEVVDKVSLLLSADAGGVRDGHGTAPANLLPPAAVCVRIEPLRIEDVAHGLAVQSTEHGRGIEYLEQEFAKRPRLDLQSLPGDSHTFDTRSVAGLSRGIQLAGESLAEATSGGARAIVLCDTDGELHRFGEVLEAARQKHAWPGEVELRLGGLSKGFRIPALDLVVVNHRELAGVSAGRPQPTKKPAHRVKTLQSFFELKLGDLVVHAVHGLARYAGLTRIERNGGEEDHLHLVFAQEVSLFVPACRIDLVQRYVGTGTASPPLDKMGSGSFRRRREKVEKAVADLAADLLEVQAVRAMKKRPAWESDAGLVQDMLASFPWDDTPDQAEVDVTVAGDLGRDRPMDRLICGDVGFGKTELAIRAAFRVVSGGGQVAVLVPTTVLAHQHHKTFSERLADFAVEVAVVSRFAGTKATRAAVAGVADGTVDILVGTHRLLSKDVDFAKLGLVIVDEEQRFGVKHKEHFKALRATTDILTLTATPIPRTLHMSLSGLRDISALTTPPAGRQEIETVLSYSEDKQALRDALLREKDRGGQVFFLHNRVQSIQRFAGELARLVPECSFVVGHGQMTGRELSKVMKTFTDGGADVLVATTIIENGIDIPSAGTIVIDRADTFGLSELHQLRGRVGRGTHKSYCYLLVEKSTPLSTVARERLKALEELSHLGAGFQISMKDLELRGAGNILGPEQSGHIGAVGYDMYCRLIQVTVDRLREGGESLEIGAGVELELGLDAYLPDRWIPSADTRLELLRELDAIQTDEDAAEALAMLRDRFGRVPAEAEALVRQFRLTARLAAVGVRRLAWRDETYLVEYDDRVALERTLARAVSGLRPVRSGLAHLAIPPKHRGAARALDWIEGLLRAGAEETTIPRPVPRGTAAR
jgi:transcription-repair coupling factor (superfamily II helicase)